MYEFGLDPSRVDGGVENGDVSADLIVMPTEKHRRGGRALTSRRDSVARPIGGPLLVRLHPLIRKQSERPSTTSPRVFTQ